MKAKLPQPVHESYLKHRKQVMWQIIFPVVFSSLLCLSLIVVINIATFRNGGDVARWAAISTIWIVIPIMIGMLLLLALLGGMIYLLVRLLNVAPTYTGLAQDYVYKAEGYIKRGLDAVVNRVIAVQGVFASVRRFFQKLKP